MRTDRLSVKILALLLSLLTLLPLASCGVTAPDETEEITAAPTTTEEATTAVSQPDFLLPLLSKVPGIRPETVE